LSGTSEKMLDCKIAEYCKAVLDGRPHFHISVVNQVSPHCDCHGANDVPIVPDIGIFASFDPVALDKACIDAVNAAPAIEQSLIGKCERKHKDGKNHDHLADIHPGTHWQDQIEHGEKIGLGSGNYDLVVVK
jgi:uncharacterized Fe-S center protein